MLKSLLKQTAVYGLSSVLGRLINYLLVALYTRVFLPAEYGVVSEWYAYISFLNIVFTYGMETGFFRFKEKEGSNYLQVIGTVFNSLLYSSTILLLILGLCSHSIATWLDYADKPMYVWVFAGILWADTISTTPFAMLRVEQKAGLYVGYKLLNIILNVVFNLLFLLPSSPLAPLFSADKALAVFVANGLASLITMALVCLHIPYSKMTYNKLLHKQLLAYSLPLLVAGLAGMINETIDRTLLKRLLPYSLNENLAQVGIYSACYKLSILMTLAIQAFRMAAEPFFFSRAKSDDAPQTYARVMHLFVAVCGGIFLGVMLYLDTVKHFIGNRYWEGLAVVPILLLANWFLGIYYNLSVWYKVTGKTAWGMYIAIIGAIITLGLNFLFIPIFGYLGAAWATLICYGSMALICYVVGQKNYNIPYKVEKIVLYLIGCLAFWYGSTYITDLGTIWNFILHTAMLLIYVAVVVKIELPEIITKLKLRF